MGRSDLRAVNSRIGVIVEQRPSLAKGASCRPTNATLLVQMFTRNGSFRRDQPRRVRRTELRLRRCASALTRLNSGFSAIGYSVAMGPAALSAPYSRSS